MNLFLHGLEPKIVLGDTIYEVPSSERFDCILTNPPFGTKGANQAPARDDFTISTSNKQLNFVQHILTILKPGGRAAVVLPENCLFADQAGEVFRILAEDCTLHTVLRRVPPEVIEEAKNDGRRLYVAHRVAAAARHVHPLFARRQGQRGVFHQRFPPHRTRARTTWHSGIGQTRIFRGQTEPCRPSRRRKILGWPECPMPGGAGREEKCASSQTRQAARPIQCRRSPKHSPHETRRHGSRIEDTSEQTTAKMTDRPPCRDAQKPRRPPPNSETRSRSRHRQQIANRQADFRSRQTPSPTLAVEPPFHLPAEPLPFDPSSVP